jgi:tRNA threonylcarbamoyladenosine biosynthesis protein TsaE
VRDPGSPCLIRLSSSPQETAALAEAMGRVAQAGDFLALDGGLGAGKTLFVAGFCAALGVPPTEVDSPSFVLLNEYQGRVPVFHFDAYRLEGDARELAEAGFLDERLSEGVVLVEWAERLTPFLPPGALRIRLEILGPSDRRIVIEEPSLRVREALR